jgi:hypothetical protein
MKPHLAPLIVALAITTAPTIAQPKFDKEAFRSAFSTLKDPGSLDARNIKYAAKSGAWSMCGEFNAKNAMGGYVGFQRFSGVAGFDKSGKKAVYFIAATGDVADMMCSQEGM